MLSASQVLGNWEKIHPMGKFCKINAANLHVVIVYQSEFCTWNHLAGVFHQQDSFTAEPVCGRAEKDEISEVCLPCSSGITTGAGLCLWNATKYFHTHVIAIWHCQSLALLKSLQPSQKAASQADRKGTSRSANQSHIWRQKQGLAKNDWDLANKSVIASCRLCVLIQRWQSWNLQLQLMKGALSFRNPPRTKRR